MNQLKKLGALVLSAAMVGTVSVGLGNEGSTVKGASSNVTIKMFQFKVEIADALKEMAREYEKTHNGTKLDIQTVGGGADYGAALKARFASGQEPDIFNDGGYADLDVWINKLEDLSNEPWVKNVVPWTKAAISKNGKVYGMPVSLEGYGFIYNKALFQKAGIKKLPHTISELEDVCKKLEAKKITPFVNGYQEWWILGIHNANVAFAQEKDPLNFIDQLKKKNTKLSGDKIFNSWVNLMDLTLKYGQKNPLTTDYNTEVTNFANGKAAMIQQGNWIQPQLDKLNPNMKLGIIPMPIDNTVQNKIYVGVPNYWVVNKDSKVKKEAKDFLNWMVSSAAGKNIIVNKFKFIPGMKNIPYTSKEIGELGGAIKDYVNSDNVLSWTWFRQPDGAVNEIGASIQKYIAKQQTKKQLLDSIGNTIYTFANKTKK